MTHKLELLALDGIPLVKAGDDLAAMALDALARMGLSLENRDVLVFAQKIVSKSEGRARPRVGQCRRGRFQR